MSEATTYTLDLLAVQGYVPESDPVGAEGAKELLDQHESQVLANLPAAQQAAEARIRRCGPSWEWEWPPHLMSSECRGGWINPASLVTSRSDICDPETMGQVAGDVADRAKREEAFRGIEVRVIQHWNGNLTQVTQDGNHRALRARAVQTPVIYCREITLPGTNGYIRAGGWNELAHEIWPREMSALMEWLLGQGLLKNYSVTEDRAATYTLADASSPLPWILNTPPKPRRTTNNSRTAPMLKLATPVSMVDLIPDSLRVAEETFGRIHDPRLDPLRTRTGVDRICRN